MTFRLTRQAEGDVIDIYLYSAGTFGIAQADAYHDKLEATFRLLADQPYIARERTEIGSVKDLSHIFSGDGSVG